MSAAAVAKAAKAKKAPKAQGKGSPSWLRGLGCGVLIMLNPATGLLLVVLLSPTLLMRVLDREHERSASRAVLLSNLAGSVGAVLALWRDGVPSVATALDLMQNIATVATAWAAAAGGWLGSELGAQVALIWLNGVTRQKLHELRKTEAELVTEWGEPPPPAPANEER